MARELVANAVLHGSNPGDKIELEVQLAREKLVLCVRGEGRTSLVSQVLPPGGSRGTGRGLAIVARLARWPQRTAERRREAQVEMDRAP